MAAPTKTTQVSIWASVNGMFQPAEVLDVVQTGMSGITLPGVNGSITYNFGKNEFGEPIVRSTSRDNPEQADITLDAFMTAAYNAVLRSQQVGHLDYLQLRAKTCGTALKNPSSNAWVVHYEDILMGNATLSDIPRDSTQSDIELGVTGSPRFNILSMASTLTAQTTTETNDANSVWFLEAPAEWADCGNGYPGPKKIGYIACDAVGAGTANILYTNDGGVNWNPVDVDPFIADEHTSYIWGQVISPTKFRVVIPRITTDVANPAEIAYADFIVGDEGTVPGGAWNFTNVGSNNGDIVTARLWPETRILLIALDTGNIYKSENQGETFTEVYTGANQINQMEVGPDGTIYAVGVSNTFLISTNNGDSFTATGYSGPTGSDASTAIKATDKGLWLGNGTSAFYSRATKPSSANQWTSSRDFGANHAIVKFRTKGARKHIGGSSQVIEAVVNDSTANEGDVWISYDGGGFWEEVTNLANSGYNDVWFSERDDNFAIIVGEDNGSTAVIHKYSA